MSAYLSTEEYVATFSKFYIRDYARDGGSAVRAALGTVKVRARVQEELEEEAKAAGFLVVSVDSSQTRIQQLQDVFFAIAKEINWPGIARRWTTRALSAELGQSVSEATLASIYERDGREPYVVRQRVDELVTRRLLRREGLSNYFRRAAYSLIWAVLEPHSARSDATPYVVQWLRGELPRIYSVKPANLYKQIGKSSARQMMASLCRFSRDAGFAGLFLTLDVGAMTGDPRTSESRRYSLSAIVDAYEVLRQFIDSIDEVEGLVLTILGDESFADGKRGTALYPALRTRLSDDVWDSNRPNAMAPMVRLWG